MTNEEGLRKLVKLNSLRLMQIDRKDSLNFLTDLPNLEALNVLPWFINVKGGYLPLIQKFRALNKLESLFEWDEIAGASYIDVDSLKESDSKNKYFKWPVF